MIQSSAIRDRFIHAGLLACALVSVATTLGIVAILARESIAFFSEVSPLAFLFGTRWEPLLSPQSFGVLPLVSGTFLITIGSAIFAIPIGVSTAVYMSAFAKPKARAVIKPLLEILAGIPTIVYGYFALTFFTPLLKSVFPQTQVFNAASGAVVVGIMILPMIASLSDDALQSVPRELKEGGYALGGTTFEIIGQICLPHASSRIMAAIILAMSRAIGETMAVTLAAGATPTLTANPLESIQTMTAYIVQVSLGDTPAGSIEYQTCFAVGTLLFIITLLMNIIGQRILRRFS